MKQKICPKCDSSAEPLNVLILERGHMNHEHNLSATVFANPSAWLFKSPVREPLDAYVCRNCGYVEFYVANPKALIDADRIAES